MDKIKVLKKGAVIKGIDFSSNFYERLSSLFVDVASSDYNSDSKQFHLETLSILMATIDEAAEEQGLTEESDIEQAGL